MKITIVNKYFHLLGGPERYMFSLMDYLATQGHEVVPFSIRNMQNQTSSYTRYFAPPVEEGKNRFSELSPSIGTTLRLASRAIYSTSAKQYFGQLLDAERPSVAYLLNIVNYLSPSVIDAAKQRGIPVIMRLSDYNLICGSHNMLRSGKACEECLPNHYYRSVQHRCVHGSLIASAGRAIAMYYHSWTEVYRKVDAFVAPSLFMANMLVRAGYPHNRIHHIPTFVNTSSFNAQPEPGNYILSYGRLAPEKGIETLIRAYALLSSPPPLWIVGDSEGMERERLEALAQALDIRTIHFLGKRTGNDLTRIIMNAKFVVVPSVSYDNTPNTIYESMSSGKAVVASDIGGIPEQVNSETGLLFRPNDARDLANKMDVLLRNPTIIRQMGSNARLTVEKKYTIQRHAEALMTLFQSVNSSNDEQIKL